MKKLLAQVIATCRATGCKLGICGMAPSDYPEFIQFLVEQVVDSISLNPNTALKTTLTILNSEATWQHTSQLPAFASRRPAVQPQIKGDKKNTRA